MDPSRRLSRLNIDITHACTHTHTFANRHPGDQAGKQKQEQPPTGQEEDGAAYEAQFRGRNLKGAVYYDYDLLTDRCVGLGFGSFQLQLIVCPHKNTFTA